VGGCVWAVAAAPTRLRAQRRSAAGLRRFGLAGASALDGVHGASAGAGGAGGWAGLVLAALITWQLNAHVARQARCAKRPWRHRLSAALEYRRARASPVFAAGQMRCRPRA
jgi:hypothetical protein